MRAQTKRARRNRRPRRPSVKPAPLPATDTTAAAEPNRDSWLLDLQRWAETPRARTVARYVGYGLAIVLVAALAGYGFASLGKKVWAARADVLYQLDAERPTGFLREDRQLTTQLVTLRSHAVLEPVAEANDLTVDELSRKLHVSVVGDSEVLRIEVHDASADRAQLLAASIADSYVASTPESSAEASAYLNEQLAELDAKIDPMVARVGELEQDRLDRASASEPTPPLTAEETVLQAELVSLFEDRSALRSRIEEVAVAELQGPQVDVVTDAYVLDDPVSPRPLLAAVAGAFAGLLVAAVAIAVLVWRQSSLTVAVVLAGLFAAAALSHPFQLASRERAEGAEGSRAAGEATGVREWGSSWSYSLAGANRRASAEPDANESGGSAPWPSSASTSPRSSGTRSSAGGFSSPAPVGSTSGQNETRSGPGTSPPTTTPTTTPPTTTPPTTTPTTTPPTTTPPTTTPPTTTPPTTSPPERDPPLGINDAPFP